MLCFAFLLFFADWTWELPQGFPRPAIPATNQMSEAKVELGRHLFYDRHLSANGSQSCGDCHRQELAFTDGRSRAKGSTGQIHPRGSMSIVNIAYAPSLTWTNPKLYSLEQQSLVPMLGTDPVELGLKGHEAALISYLESQAVYRRLFAAAFVEAKPYTLDNITRAIAAFERSIVSLRSPYDRYRWYGDMDAIYASAKRGEILFSSSEKAGCFQCHGGWNFSSVRYEGHQREENRMGIFKAPTLRNIVVTAPYMHDGRLPTLEAVIDHYAKGGPGSDAELVSRLRPFTLTPQEKQDLIEFLRTLTDQALLHDKRWRNPWR